MSDDQDVPLRRMGPNSFIRIEPPDIFYSCIVDSFTGPDAVACAAGLRRAAGDGGRLFWLADFSRVSAVTAEARKLGARELPTLPLRAAVWFGASFQHRVAASLSIAAMRVLYPSSEPPVLVFFETEAAARAWIEENRGALARRGSADEQRA